MWLPYHTAGRAGHRQALQMLLRATHSVVRQLVAARAGSAPAAPAAADEASLLRQLIYTLDNKYFQVDTTCVCRTRIVQSACFFLKNSASFASFWG